MALVELTGFAAACLTTASFLPQVWRSVRTRDLGGISLGMYLTFTVGVALWLAYGVMLRAWPIVLANSVTLALAGTILALKLRSLRQQRPRPPA
jgi:MtN3 and saliva related transmembrane protein